MYDELQLDTLGDKKTVLFLIMSDTDSTFNFLISMVYTQLFNLLCDKADDVYGGKLPIHVRCLIDECANIGQIPNLEKLVATIRSREISACLVLQAKSQLKAIYKDNADTIIGNMDSQIFLGGSEPGTLKDLSEMLGKETIDAFNTSDTRGNSPSYGTNYSKLGHELLSRDEIAVLDALEQAKEPMLPDLLMDYFNLRNEQRSDWSGKAKLKCTVRDFEEVKRAVDYLKARSLNTIEDLDTAISNLNQTTAPLRKQLKQNENRMRAIAQIKDAAAVHAELKPVHDTFIKKNFKLTKDAYAAQHKDELDAFNKAVRTLMKLNGSTAVDFSALDAEFSALQSSSAELRTQLETLQPDISALKNIRKYIDMVLNKQQLSAPGGKTPEKESVLKQLEQFQQKKSHHKTTSTPPNREESL